MRTISDKMQTAVVASVQDDGLTLIFPGSDEPSVKRYKYNKTIDFAVGDRVMLLPSGGTYVVAFPI